MKRDVTGSSAMTTDVSGVDSHQQDSRVYHQNTTPCIIYQAAYRIATFATGGPISDHEPGVGSLVQAPARDTTSRHLPAVSLLSAVAGPVVQPTKTVREVEIGPGITLLDLTLDDYSFITSLPVIEEQH